MKDYTKKIDHLLDILTRFEVKKGIKYPELRKTLMDMVDTFEGIETGHTDFLSSFIPKAQAIIKNKGITRDQVKTIGVTTIQGLVITPEWQDLTSRKVYYSVSTGLPVYHWRLFEA